MGNSTSDLEYLQLPIYIGNLTLGLKRIQQFLWTALIKLKASTAIFDKLGIWGIETFISIPQTPRNSQLSHIKYQYMHPL